MRGVGQAPALPCFGEEVALDGAELGDQLLDGVSGLEVDRSAPGGQRAQGRPELIDRAAFQAVARDQQFAARFRLTRSGDDVLQRLAFRPGEQRREATRFPSRSSPAASGAMATPRRCEDRCPCAVRAGFRPRTAAEREDHGIRFVVFRLASLVLELRPASARRGAGRASGDSRRSARLSSRRRCTQRRSSGAPLSARGYTRPVEAAKVSTPSPAAHARRASASKSAISDAHRSRGPE